MKVFLKNLNLVKYSNLFKISARNFRDWRKDDLTFTDDRYWGGKIPSPYKPQFTLTEEEKIANEKLPVHERVLDFEKYLRHKGELKYSMGLFYMDVEPFPRLKVMMICHVILNLLQEFDNTFLYKFAVKESIKFIMEVVDQNEVLVDIENALIKFESLENLICKLDDEVTLLRWFLKDNHYKKMNILNDAEKEEMKNFTFNSAFFQQPVSQTTEKNTHKKHEKPERPSSYDDLV